jgi:hypothetical protein
VQWAESHERSGALPNIAFGASAFRSDKEQTSAQPRQVSFVRTGSVVIPAGKRGGTTYLEAVVGPGIPRAQRSISPRVSGGGSLKETHEPAGHALLCEAQQECGARQPTQYKQGNDNEG